MLNEEMLDELINLTEEYLREKNENPNSLPEWHTLHEELLASGFDEDVLHKLGIYDR